MCVFWAVAYRITDLEDRKGGKVSVQARAFRNAELWNMCARCNHAHCVHTLGVNLHGMFKLCPKYVSHTVGN